MRTLRAIHIALQHAAQGSNLPLPDLESGVPPLELPARRCGAVEQLSSRPQWNGTTIGHGDSLSCSGLVYCSTVLLLHCSMRPLAACVGRESNPHLSETAGLRPAA